MSFPRYPKYKDSGVEWLGEVPEHWDVMPLKRLSHIRYGIGEPPAYHSEGTPLIRATNVHNGHIDPSGVVFVNPDEIPAQRILWLDAGDIIVVRSGAYTGDSATVTADLGPCIAGFDMVLKCHGANPAFIQYVLLSCYVRDGQIALQRMRAAQPHLNAEELGQCVATMPKLSEQAAIATFLDRETAKIDALIAEQQRLIELLQEKRQAVISHAVTKGLNPNAKMKDSGIEWLGKVPEHWEVAPLRRMDCLVQTGPFGSQLHAHEYVHGGTPIVNPTHMVNGRIVPTEDATVTSDVVARLPHQRLANGDVVFSRRGELGRCALVTEKEEGWLCGTGSMILRLSDAMYASEYLSLFLSMDLLRQYFESYSVGSVMDSLSSDTLLAMPVIIPPITEQQACAIYAAEQSTFIDAMTESASGSIALLQERRSALISAAVTGQIDVRGLAGSEAA